MNPTASVFGAAMDTGNLGVSALGASCVFGLHRQGWQVTLFDNGRGTESQVLNDGVDDVGYWRQGAWHSRRLYRPESLHLMRAMSTGRIGFLNPGLQTLRRSKAVFDISGGDSFTDLYGRKRYETVVLPKRIALSQNRPLILLPQTFGPFRLPQHQREARTLICRSRQAWARDSDSFLRLREILGSDFDPARHRQGVDVAFSLPSVQPPIPEEFADWLTADEPLAAVNVSGLLFRSAANQRRFGLRADYAAAVFKLVTWLLDVEGVRVLLIPHVIGDSPESDQVACKAVREALPSSDRLRQAPQGLNALETKWLISRSSWITAARMHATIAALSTHVPVSATAYSDKVAGVFRDCGLGAEISDARALSTNDLFESWKSGWTRRNHVAEELCSEVPRIVASSAQQFESMVTAVTEGSLDA